MFEAAPSLEGDTKRAVAELLRAAGVGADEVALGHIVAGLAVARVAGEVDADVGVARDEVAGKGRRAADRGLRGGR